MSEDSYSTCPESYDQGTSREWLVTNGLGGYSSSTVISANTRAYHGLLVAALSPPVERTLLLSSLDEEVNGVLLANHQYPGAVHPQGFKHLAEFRFDPLPCFIYKAGDAKVEKTVFMIHGDNTTIIRYRLQGQGLMQITPLVHSRSFHAASSLPQIRQEPLKAGTLLHSGSSRLFLLSDRARFKENETIYYNFEYEEERRRGLSWKENLFCPGYFELDFKGDTAFSIMASTWRSSMPDAEKALFDEISRLRSLKSPLPGLAQAADSFLVRRGDGKSIIAGYHWFDDWGRDAMIALPGLLLVTGRFEEAREVLRNYAQAMKGGVLPNDLGAKSYNTVDASLWFIQALYSYYDYSEDLDFAKRMWPSLMSIVKRYSEEGEGFRMNSDGLILSGPALTWMDARVDGRPMTPRDGKACEINALWFDGLGKMKVLANALGQPWDEGLAERVRESYQRFWNSETGCLFDVLDHEDASIRPNQIFAAAIPDLLPMIKRKSILDSVTRDLLTPYGLRTLSPRDPRYIGRYEGGPAQRDSAYHQGTVWPWLMGPYIRAFLSVNDFSEESRRQAKRLLGPLVDLQVAGVRTIPEVFDGDAPHRAGGCISQAWSVAEVLRAWHEDVEGYAKDERRR